MNVAMMQPAFMPWLGYFELIYRSDRFIFLDDFQFSVQSYHQRNRLFVNRGQVDWYTVPVQKSVSFKAPLNETVINEKIPWRKKAWKRIQANYSKAPYYDEIAPIIEDWLLTPAGSLAAQNIAFIKTACSLMGIKRDFRYSSQYPSESQRSARVLELLRHCGANRYYCARGSFGYMLEDTVFPVNDIEVLFQDFKPQPYYQVCAIDGFIPFLSVVDSLLNVGPEATLAMIQTGTGKWLPWSGMVNESTYSSQERS